MDPIKIYLFGSPHIEIGGKIIDFRLRKAMAILCYLCTTRQPATRDALATLFWPEADQQTGRASLRRTIYSLKQMVGSHVLSLSSDTIGIRPRKDLWTDTGVFETLSPLLQQIDGHKEPIKRLSETAELYTGDFMAGFSLDDCAEFDDWQFFQKEYWQALALRAMDALISQFDAAGEFQEAISWGRRRLSFDRLHEPTYCVLMNLYDRIGDRASAIRVFRQCERILKAELYADPQKETKDLYHTIQRERGSTTRENQRPKTHYVKSAENYIAYQHTGSGPVDVLFVSGFVSHIEYLWKEPELAAFFREIARFSRLILFDKQGIGLSDRCGNPPDIHSTIQDIEAVLDASGAGQAILIGASEGGPAIIEFARTHPGRCLGLVLYGTLAKGTKTAEYPYALTRAQYDKWLAHLVSGWGGALGIEDFAPSRKHDPRLKKWWATLLRLSTSPGTIRLVLESLRDIDVRQHLANIMVPTLILHRKNDQAVPVEAGRYISHHIPNCRYVELEGKDHWWWVGNTAPILHHIRVFTQGLTGAR